MSVFLLPSTLQDELEKMMNSFQWGNKNQSRRGMHRKLGKLTMKKDQGSMGFKHLHAFNLAMLRKQG